ncbi:DUF3298 and DUF4163 domain-containing protein [Flavobacterium rhizosphaerae]|uniref:DUF4163 domain-containing protein n=1 Tax=Flavobacterium rhizosphaerae TaxID=3163298 RepID=A0ABW8YYQ0_9FLAO
MKKYFYILLLAATTLTAYSCKKDKEENLPAESEANEPAMLSFDSKEYNQKTTMPCKGEQCTNVSISVPEATGMGEVSDSINKKIFNVTRSIVYFGEKPTDAKSYKELMDSFIKSYEELRREFPDEDLPWEAKINASVEYRTDSIINVELKNYMFTGGAHGYEGLRSLLFSPKTGHSLTYDDIFKDKAGFKSLAEKMFRKKYNIAPTKNINSTGLFFEGDTFALPLNIFFREDGLLLYYNPVEVGSFADGSKELLIPYSQAKPYISIKQ